MIAKLAFTLARRPGERAAARRCRGQRVEREADRVAPPSDVLKLVDKLKTQRGIEITHDVIPGAGHFFDKQLEEMTGKVERYVQSRTAVEDAS